MPLTFLSRWLAVIVGMVVLVVAIHLIYSWWDGPLARDAAGAVRVQRGESWRLWSGVVLLGWSFFGRFPTLLFFRKDRAEPKARRVEGALIDGPHGARLWVESIGPADAPVIVFTHGWGMNATVWWYAKAHLSETFRLVMWDLPGLGRSTRFSDGEIGLDRFADSLKAVVDHVGADKVLLVGHSIGGMITQTLARDHAQFVEARAAGLVLVDTTYTDPLRTMIMSGLFRAVRVPLIKPLLWLQIVLAPLVWLLNWKSYLDGSMLIVTRLTGFGRFATRGQIDMTSLLAVKGSPGVQAKGDLAMITWDATGALAEVATPILILAGTKDIITLPRASAEMDRQAGNSELQPVEGCGHMGFLERADIYDSAIGTFAARVLARTTPAVSAPVRL